MTRKDYVAIATALSDMRPDDDETNWEDRSTQWYCDIGAIADVLAADNPRFDRERFLSACEK